MATSSITHNFVVSNPNSVKRFVAAIASVKRELGGKWAVIMVVWQCLIAWVMAFVVHAVVMLF